MPPRHALWEDISHLCRLRILGYFGLEAGPSRYGPHMHQKLNSPASVMAAADVARERETTGYEPFDRAREREVGILLARTNTSQ